MEFPEAFVALPMVFSPSSSASNSNVSPLSIPSYLEEDPPSDLGPPNKRYFMKLLVRSISTDEDREAARIGYKKPVVVETKEEKTPDPDWAMLQKEIEEMIEITVDLNKQMHQCEDFDMIHNSIKQTAEIFTRREELFNIIHPASPSHPRRETLTLLYKLRDIDDKDHIGTVMNTMALFQNSLKQPKVIKSIHEILELRPRDDENVAKNYLMAFGATLSEMYEKNEKEKAAKSDAKFRKPLLPSRPMKRVSAKPVKNFYMSKNT